MKIVNKKIDEVFLYANNPRKNDMAVDKIAASIKEFGFKVPIVIDKKGVIVAGNTRYKASRQLGLEEIPCLVADDLTEEQIKAFRLADNKTAEFAEWDDSLLELELLGIDEIDMSKFGFELDLEEDKKEVERKSKLKSMPLKAFEHYDYVVFVFKNQQDWLNIVNKFGIEKVDAGYGATKKVGVGRVFDGKRLLEEI